MQQPHSHSPSLRQKRRYTTPPPSLIYWLRKASLVETLEYSSEENFRDKAYSILLSLEAKVGEMYSLNAFWNIAYRGNRITSRRPKRETDIHPVIQAILSDQMMMSSIDVVPEYTTGAGRLDFMLIANVKNVGLGKICMEVKSAHSSDLVDGLIGQLPTYMKNKNVNLGIYVVLWYGARLKPSTHDASIIDLNVRLTSEMSRHFSQEVCKRIRVFVVDLTKPKSASRTTAFPGVRR